MLPIAEKLRICALVMGYTVVKGDINFVYATDPISGHVMTYHPHKSNDQAFQLLKRFHLYVEPPPKDRIEDGWLVHCKPKGVTACNVDLNLAIVDCVVACKELDK